MNNPPEKSEWQHARRKARSLWNDWQRAGGAAFAGAMLARLQEGHRENENNPLPHPLLFRKGEGEKPDVTPARAATDPLPLRVAPSNGERAGVRCSEIAAQLYAHWRGLYEPWKISQLLNALARHALKEKRIAQAAARGKGIRNSGDRIQNEDRG